MQINQNALIKHLHLDQYAGIRKIIVVGIMFLCVGLAVYGNTLAIPFLSDDYVYLNSIMRFGFSGMWGKAHGVFFRPMVDLSFWLDFKVWGFNAWGYHLANILLHTANALLAGVFCREIFRRAHNEREDVDLIGVLSGLLFLVLPSHSEAVTWISGRNDLIATLFILGSLVLGMRFIAKPGFRILLIFTLANAFALFSKETAITIPLSICLLGGYQFIQRRKERVSIGKRAVLLLMISLTLLALYIFVRYLFLGKWIGGYGAQVHCNLKPFEVLANTGKALLRSISPPIPLEWQGHHVMKMMLLGLGLFIVPGWVLLKQQTTSLFHSMFPIVLCVVLFCVTYLPSSNLFLDFYTSYGERFIYLPSVFASGAIAVFISEVFRNHRVRVSVASMLILMGVAGSIYANQHWITAGKISANILDDAGKFIKQGKTMVLNLPDNLRGAYIFRNGFLEAIYLKYHHRAFVNNSDKGIQVVGIHSLYAENDRAVVRNTIDAISIDLNTSKAVFTQLYWADSESFKKETSGVMSPKLTLKYNVETRNDAEMLLYSAGHLHNIAEIPQ